jgi:signal transduction histidine kinase
MYGSEDNARAVTAIARVDVLPTLLKVLCEMTGVRFAAVARVAGDIWTAYAVRDELSLGMGPGSELAPALRSVKSFVSVPIIVGNGRHFGALCALDVNVASLRGPRLVPIFKEFAVLIGSQLEHEFVREREQTALLDERATGELRERFIAILGHDLRNPLQAVFASGDLLERRLTDPALQVIASRIKTHVLRMSSLIDDLLDFARGRQAGGIGLELTDVQNVNAGLTTVVQELQDAQPECRILSNISVSRSVRCDLGRLQQVAANLLGNALTHGRPESPVTITARTDENDFVLEVWNAGEPIPPESLGKIFEPFWRCSVSPSRNGLGLGLHICSQIIRAHDGGISVTSTRESGTQFTARLPLGAFLEMNPSFPEAIGAESRRQSTGSAQSVSQAGA